MSQKQFTTIARGLTFEQALTALKNGGLIRKSSWVTSNHRLMLITPEINPDIIHPFIAYYIQDDMFLPWSPTQDQILATDWDTIEEVAEESEPEGV